MASAAAFSSPWTLSSPYWIIFAGAHDANPPHDIDGALREAGLARLHDHAGYMGLQTNPEWTQEWRRITQQIGGADYQQLRAAVIASDTLPGVKEIGLNLRGCGDIQDVVRHLWLADDLSEGRLLCYMQKVIDRRGNVMGCEAFARIAQADGSIVGGGAIMQASHALKVEYQVDRLMHRQAVETFVQGACEGTLFINFLTGFIHRPEVYLEGLSQAVEKHGLHPRSIALDVPLGAYARDLAKLQSIADYCRARGFLLAFDDVQQPDGLEALLGNIRPAIVKLDAKLSAQITDPRKAPAVQEILRLAHAAGASVLAEGIENDAVHAAYHAAGVDLFQGYLIGAPEKAL